ncbi:MULTISPECIES: dienelactone hydrolase family protein [Rhodanobacter]|uniref:Dienelactone hydrolase-like enzyme n=1 Tax=Rhodanobacter denitrificans TaxID=666685 RepID=I4WEV3_9GAMM|nr:MULTISPECIES: dienelactone hydrolase family protein [Rhodanobacter]AGG90315.1 dienelactone hydrolase-like enzyme [Rhodanobacter denitrificans]EIL97994.1 dienelactone hydrolase [Rhodanobacter denitrificans]KZC20125.1 dienelactone hydrolase [Rhodanobacter denitrificans]UJJ50405.1 dienelactone hydrolase family protein [Rhodanobacter denitrificans]UJJ57411.1 dienelactone hydrolase family protein [Rhodanobacter denitrificans]
MRIARLCCLLLFAGSSLAAQAKMVHRPVEWTQDGTRFHSVLLYDDASSAKRPGLVMVPNWYGINDVAVKKAEMIAGKDYVILLTDMYGADVRPQPGNAAQAQAAVKPLYGDRALMRKRINVALDQLKAQAASAPLDASKLAAIGFCFGGSAVLDLARSGAGVAAVVSFHGGLDTDDPTLAKHIKARVLAMNGADDKGTMPDADKFMDEMRMSPVDWQFVVIGHAVHCFTEVGENSPGCRYDERAATRSYRLMHDWLRAAFAGTP